MSASLPPRLAIRKSNSTSSGKRSSTRTPSAAEHVAQRPAGHAGLRLPKTRHAPPVRCSGWFGVLFLVPLRDDAAISHVQQFPAEDADEVREALDLYARLDALTPGDFLLALHDDQPDRRDLEDSRGPDKDELLGEVHLRHLVRPPEHLPHFLELGSCCDRLLRALLGDRSVADMTEPLHRRLDR